jgi:hypothetical protein
MDLCLIYKANYDGNLGKLWASLATECARTTLGPQYFPKFTLAERERALIHHGGQFSMLLHREGGDLDAVLATRSGRQR